MKTLLLSFLLAGIFSFSETYAQPCSLANLQIENVYTGADGKCYADVFFDMDRDNGNRFIYIHFWNTTNYNKVAKARFKKGSGPKNADINGTTANPYPALATIAIDNNNYTAPVWSSYNYRPDATVTVVKGSSILVSSSPISGSGSKAMYRYYVKAVPLGTVAGGCSAANLGVVIWSTQSSSANSHIHCSLIGPVTPQFPLTITGSVNCATAKYTINVANTTSNTISGAIDIYADNGIRPNDGTFDPSTDAKFDEISYFLIEPNQTFTITRSVPAQYLGYNLFSQVMLSNNATQVQQLLTTTCGTLPVKIQSFNAVRNRQNVLVKWQTASEQYVRGFNILRMTEGEWKVVAFIPSQAADGFSSQALAYQYTDANTFKGISQYRIQEVAADGKSGLSDVKLVRGEEQAAGITLFPNPTTNGKVNIVFDNTSVRDILVTDISGRTVKQLKAVTTSNVQLENLNNGFYNVQVIDRTTNETVTQKLVVKL